MSLTHFTGNAGILREIEPTMGRPDLANADRWNALIEGGSRTGVELAGACTLLMGFIPLYSWMQVSRSFLASPKFCPALSMFIIAI